MLCDKAKHVSKPWRVPSAPGSEPWWQLGTIFLTLSIEQELSPGLGLSSLPQSFSTHLLSFIPCKDYQPVRAQISSFLSVFTAPDTMESCSPVGPLDTTTIQVITPLTLPNHLPSEDLTSLILASHNTCQPHFRDGETVS